MPELAAGLHLRVATPEDLGALEALDRRVWDDQSSPTGSVSGAAFGAGRAFEDTWVAVRVGRVLGFVTIGRRTQLASNRHVAVVRVLAVAPECRGEGLGLALLQRAKEEARRRGYRKLSLTVLGSNGPALRLYQRVGFVIEGRLRGEFELGGRLVDDVLLGCALDP